MLANSKATSTSLGALGLDLHSSSPEPVNFFGAQSSLGAHKQSFGGHDAGIPPRGARPALMGSRDWFQRSGFSSVEFLLAESDSVERYDHNVLKSTFCFQLSTVFQFYWYIPFTEVESLRTHFEVLGLEASSPQKLRCPRLENNSIFGILKILYIVFCRKTCFFGDFLILFFWEHLKKNFEDFIIIFFGGNTCACVLALEKVCSRKGCLWPRIFFCVLGLEPCALSSTSVPCPFRPNVKRLSSLSHISFYINFIQSTPGNTIDGAWCVACRCRLSSRIVKRFDCANNA